jgi:hypothetical protein
MFNPPCDGLPREAWVMGAEPFPATRPAEVVLAKQSRTALVETAADQDVAALSKDLPIQQMIQNIEDKVGRRPVTERELREQRKNSPFMAMSYVLARNNQAQDWFNSVTIGGNQNLELHHIFPKEVLRESYDLRAHGRTVDQVANLAFLSRRANSRIRSKPPVEYLPSLDPHNLRAQ